MKKEPPPTTKPPVTKPAFEVVCPCCDTVFYTVKTLGEHRAGASPAVQEEDKENSGINKDATGAKAKDTHERNGSTLTLQRRVLGALSVNM